MTAENPTDNQDSLLQSLTFRRFLRRICGEIRFPPSRKRFLPHLCRDIGKNEEKPNISPNLPVPFRQKNLYNIRCEISLSFFVQVCHTVTDAYSPNRPFWCIFSQNSLVFYDFLWQSAPFPRKRMVYFCHSPPIDFLLNICYNLYDMGHCVPLHRTY